MGSLALASRGMYMTGVSIDMSQTSVSRSSTFSQPTLDRPRALRSAVARIASCGVSPHLRGLCLLITIPWRSFVRGAKLGQTVRIQSELVNMGPSCSFQRHPPGARPFWSGDKRDMTANVLSEADPVLRTTAFSNVQARLWLTPASSSTTPSPASSWHTVRACFSSSQPACRRGMFSRAEARH